MNDFSHELNRLYRSIEAACGHYHQSAPAVADYLDDLYVRFTASPASVALLELLFVERLQSDGWLPANYAQNDMLHMLNRLKRDTSLISDH